MTMTIQDDGSGFEQPIMVKDEYLAIFDTGISYTIRLRGTDKKVEFPKIDVTEDFWSALRKNGWEDAEFG